MDLIGLTVSIVSQKFLISTMTAYEFSIASEDEQMQVIEAIDTVQLYDAVVKIVEYNGESQVRLQKLTACAVEVSDLEEKSKEPGQKRPKK